MEIFSVEIIFAEAVVDLAGEVAHRDTIVREQSRYLLKIRYFVEMHATQVVGQIVVVASLAHHYAIYISKRKGARQS